MATTKAEIADDDLLIVEGMMARGIWDELTIMSCSKAGGTRCKLICPHPCKIAGKVIEYCVPCYFRYYARWN